MTEFCISKGVAERLKQAFRNGDISIPDLYDMGSPGRHATFSQYVSEGMAHKLNAAFEKAMDSEQENALADMVKKYVDPKSKVHKTIVDKITSVHELGILNSSNSDDFLYDFVADILGVSVTPQEAMTIYEKSNKLEPLAEKMYDSHADMLAYFMQRRDLQNYMDGLTPSSNLGIFTLLIGRGVKLATVSAPITNILSNTVRALEGVVARRVSNGTMAANHGKILVDYWKNAMAIYTKTGYDITRMETLYGEAGKGLAPMHVKGEKVVSAQGPGAIRATARFFETYIFRGAMGIPDVASSAYAHAEIASIAGDYISKKEGLVGEAAIKRAGEIMEDALRISPQLPEGIAIREQAIAEAMRVTYTENAAFSEGGMKLRNVLDSMTGELNLGTVEIPFVKTPANVAQQTLEQAGVGVVQMGWKLPEAIRAWKAGNPQLMKALARTATEMGVGMALAVVLALSTDPDDFVGDYDLLSPKEKEIAKLKNAPYNSVKVGNKYWSLDYLGPVASQYVGIMYARKYGKTFPDQAFNYARGSLTQLLRFPGFSEIGDLLFNIADSLKKTTAGEVVESTLDDFVSTAGGMVMPGLVGQFARGVDPYARETDKEAWKSFQSIIPWARQSLQPKINQITGKPIESEGVISTILFGARVKTPQESPLIDEIVRLYNNEAAPAIMDIKYASSRMKELREQIGADKYTEALKYYGRQYAEKATKKIESPTYENITDEDKRKLLNNIRDRVLENTLLKFGYKKPKKK